MSVHELPFHLTSQDLITTNLRLHWREQRARARNLRALAGWAARSAGVPRMARAQIVARITWPDRRRRDAHNLVPTLKHLVDGIVDAGVLPDDDDAHLTGAGLPPDRGRAAPLGVGRAHRPDVPRGPGDHRPRGGGDPVPYDYDRPKRCDSCGGVIRPTGECKCSD